MSNYVTIELFRSGDDWFVEKQENSESILEVFYLENGIWRQECVPPLYDEDVELTETCRLFMDDYEEYKRFMSMKRIDNGEKLLDMLNNKLRIDCGCVCNIMGEIIN